MTKQQVAKTSHSQEWLKIQEKLYDLSVEAKTRGLSVNDWLELLAHEMSATISDEILLNDELQHDEDENVIVPEKWNKVIEDLPNAIRSQISERNELTPQS